MQVERVSREGARWAQPWSVGCESLRATWLPLPLAARVPLAAQVLAARLRRHAIGTLARRASSATRSTRSATPLAGEAGQVGRLPCAGRAPRGLDTRGGGELGTLPPPQWLEAGVRSPATVGRTTTAQRRRGRPGSAASAGGASTRWPATIGAAIDPIGVITMFPMAVPATWSEQAEFRFETCSSTPALWSRFAL